GRQRTTGLRQKISAVELERHATLIGRLLKHHRERNAWNLCQLLRKFPKLAKAPCKARITRQRGPAWSAARGDPCVPHQSRFVTDSLGLCEPQFDAGAGSQLDWTAENPDRPVRPEQTRVGGKSALSHIWIELLLYLGRVIKCSG